MHFQYKDIKSKYVKVSQIKRKPEAVKPVSGWWVLLDAPVAQLSSGMGRVMHPQAQEPVCYCFNDNMALCLGKVQALEFQDGEATQAVCLWSSYLPSLSLDFLGLVYVYL
jgi:hypothetical protein